MKINFLQKDNKLISTNLGDERGFTLVEALTAIFILTFVIVGLMTVVSSSLFAARYARDEVTANYLLQEVIDYVRNDRDTSVFLETNPGGLDTAWSEFYAKYTDCVTNGCTIDVMTGDSSIEACSSTECPYLYLNENATNTSNCFPEDMTEEEKSLIPLLAKVFEFFEDLSNWK